VDSGIAASKTHINISAGVGSRTVLRTLLRERGGYKKRKALLRIALVYPNLYRVGMANLGYLTVYSIFNSYPGVSCERFFLDIENSMESNSPLASFDIVAFSLQYELDYMNVVKMLVSAGIEPLRERRRRPLIIAGGPCCYNPLPLSSIVDLFVVGEVEPVASRIVEGFAEGVDPVDLADEDGIFVSALGNEVRAAKARDMDTIPAPTNQPQIESEGLAPALGKTFLVEVSRGCNMLCRFCMYSHCTLPRRDRSAARLRGVVREGLRVTGARKVSLIGALVLDHPEIKDILGFLASEGVTASLPSARIDQIDEEILTLMGELGVRTLTVAPEGSPHIRTILKKGIDEEGLRQSLEEASSYGIRRLKLYFIVGIPGQTEEDLEYIVDLCTALSRSYGGRRGLSVSVNPLVPKPHTPTQFMAMEKMDELANQYSYLRRRLSGKVSLKLESIRESVVQAYLANGDERCGRVILKVIRGRPGFASWRRAAEDESYPIERVYREREEFPWAIVKTGISPDYLRAQYDEMVR